MLLPMMLLPTMLLPMMLLPMMRVAVSAPCHVLLVSCSDCPIGLILLVLSLPLPVQFLLAILLGKMLPLLLLLLLPLLILSFLSLLVLALAG